MYQQAYNPLGNAFLSTLVAAIPIFTLLYFIALHPRRDAQGNVHRRMSFRALLRYRLWVSEDK